MSGEAAAETSRDSGSLTIAMQRSFLCGGDSESSSGGGSGGSAGSRFDGRGSLGVFNSSNAGFNSEPRSEQPGRKHQRANRMSVFAMPGGASDMRPKGMLADKDALTADLHRNIAEKDYDVTDFYYESGCAQALAKSSKYNTLTLLVIGLNTFWIGLDAECNNANDLGRFVTGCPFQSYDTAFWIAGENFFCAFFTLEVCVRFAAFQHKWRAWRDGWFKFDSMLVLFMIAETWIVPIAIQGESSMANLTILRMLRLLRLTRMIRLMRSVSELLTLLKGMVIAAQSVMYTLLLLLILLYIFAIIFKSQLVDTKVPTLKKHFPDILKSMWTLAISGCLLDDVEKIGNLLLEHHQVMAAAWLVFIFLSSLMVVNMLVGVLCHVVTEVAAAEKEKALVNYVRHRLLSVLHQLDQNGDGTIDKNEFKELVNIPEAKSALTDLGVDIPNFIELSDFLFEDDTPEVVKAPARLSEEQLDIVRATSASSASFLDTMDDAPTIVVGGLGMPAEVAAKASEGDKGEEQEELPGKDMEFAEFLEMVIRLRSENQPSVADIVELRKLVCKTYEKLHDRIDKAAVIHADLRHEVRQVKAQLDTAMLLAMDYMRSSDMLEEFGALLAQVTARADRMASRRARGVPKRSPTGSLGNAKRGI